MSLRRMRQFIWAQCYGHSFRQILPIFGEQTSVFLGTQC
jgi:hypothetical protein